MTLEQAYLKLTEYTDGELSVEDRRELERLASIETDLAEAIILCRTVNFALENQAELTPRLDFTVDVLRKCGIINEYAESTRTRWLRRIERWAPVAGIAGALALFAKPTWQLIEEGCVTLGDMVGRTTGIQLFVTEPMLILAVAVPIIVVGFAAMFLSDRWRISRY